MKLQQLIILSLFCLSTMACKNESNTVGSDKNGNATEQSDADKPSAINTDNKTEAQLEKLKKLTPYTEEELNALFPEQLAGIKLDKTSIMPDSQTAYGYYKQRGYKEINITLVDCAGDNPFSKRMFSHYMQMRDNNYTDSNEQGYVKQLNEGGLKGREEFLKRTDTYNFYFIVSDRWTVMITSNKIEREQVWQAVQEFAEILEKNQ